MGYDTVRLEASASVSRHNAPKDDVHNATWRAFVAEVKHLVGRREFAALDITVSADEVEVGLWS